MPVKTRVAELRLTQLLDDVLNRRVDLLLRNLYMGVGDRNKYGAITYEPHGTATEPHAFTQVFPNGELWAVTTEMFTRHQGDILIPTTNVKNIFGRVLENFVSLSGGYGNGWPVRVVMGGVGLSGARLGIGWHQVSEPIHVDEREIRRELSSGAPEERAAAVLAWLDELYDIAGVRAVDLE